MRVLFVLTSHDQMGDTDKKTGFWLEEFATPYYLLKDAGADITIATPKGGSAPIDPTSQQPDAQSTATRRFREDAEAQTAVDNTDELSRIDIADFDAVFYPGGHGPLWDLTTDEHSIELIERALEQGKPVAAVCHAPAVLVNAKGKDGSPLVAGKKVAGFSNSEERAVGLADTVPFLLEDRLTELGAEYSRGEDWAAHMVRDGLLITGQNPASSGPVANELLSILRD